MSDEAWGKLMDLAITCGMNERYWAEMASRESQRMGYGIMFGIACILVGCLSFAILCSYKRGGVQFLIVAQLSFFAAVVAFGGFIKPVYRKQVFASEMQGRWAQLENGCDDAIRQNNENAYEDLNIERHRLNGREPKNPDMELLVKCQTDEERSRGSY